MDFINFCIHVNHVNVLYAVTIFYIFLSALRLLKRGKNFQRQIRVLQLHFLKKKPHGLIGADHGRTSRDDSMKDKYIFKKLDAPLRYINAKYKSRARRAITEYYKFLMAQWRIFLDFSK